MLSLEDFKKARQQWESADVSLEGFKAARRAAEMGPQIPATDVFNPALQNAPASTTAQPIQARLDPYRELTAGMGQNAPTIGISPEGLTGLQIPAREPSRLDPAVAFLGAANRQATYGLTGPLLERINPNLPMLEAQHPWAAGVGGVAGDIAAISGAARIAGMLPRVASLPMLGQEAVTGGVYGALRGKGDPRTAAEDALAFAAIGGVLRKLLPVGKAMISELPLRPTEGLVKPPRLRAPAGPAEEYIGAGTRLEMPPQKGAPTSPFLPERLPEAPSLRGKPAVPETVDPALQAIQSADITALRFEALRILGGDKSPQVAAMGRQELEHIVSGGRLGKTSPQVPPTPKLEGAVATGPAAPPAASAKAARDALVAEGVPRAKAHKLAKTTAPEPAQQAPAVPKAEVPTKIPEKATVPAEAPIEPAPQTAAESEATGLSRRGIRELEERWPQLKELGPEERRTWEQDYQKAIDAKADQDAIRIAKEVTKNRRPLKGYEYAGFVKKATELDALAREASADAARLVDEGNPIGAAFARAKRDGYLKDIETLVEGATYGKRETARAMNIFKTAMNAEDYSITTLVDHAKAAKGSALTEAERSILAESAGQIKALQSELEAAKSSWRAAQERAAQLEAQFEVRRQAQIAKVLERTAPKRAALEAEREQIKKQIAALGYRLNDITGVSVEGSYLIGKLATNYIKGGALTLEEVVRLVKADIPELTTRDIYDALNARNPKIQARARSEVQQRVETIKTEARLIREAELSESLTKTRAKLSQLRLQATKSGIEADELQGAMDAITELQEQLRALKRGVGRKPTAEELQPIRERLKDLRRELKIDETLADLNEQLRTGEFKVPERVVARKVPENVVRKQAELDRVRQQVRALIADMEPMTGKRRAIEVLNSLRTLKATADMSYTLRQGMVLTAGHPKGAAKAFGKAFQSFFSQNTAEQIQAELKLSPNWWLYEKSGLFLPELGSTALAKREEMFMSRWLERIGIVRASERHMVVGLNQLRAAAFDDFLRAVPNATDAELKAWANWVNIASGRGNIKFVNKNANELATVIFAPRFSASRIQVPKEVFRRGIGPRVRKAIAKDMAAFGGLGLTALGLASLAGWETSADPRSPDFGKIKVGDTRYDLWGGVQQPMRLFGRLALLGTNTIGLTEIKNDIDPIETMYWFSRYKAAPVINIGTELLTGKTVLRQKVQPLAIPYTDIELPPFTRTIANSFVPLVIDDIADVYRNEGELGPMLPAGAAAFLGIGVQTYQKRHNGGLYPTIPKPKYPTFPKVGP